jgi:phage terminase small subunit
MRNGARERYEKFACEYAIDRNGTRAAIAAGYSERSAAQQASELLRIPKVRALIDGHVSRLAEKADLKAERVIRGLCCSAFFDPRKLFNADGSLKQVAELDDETAGALAGMEVEKLYEHFGKGNAKEVGTITKIKFKDSIRALELLGKHFKMFMDRTEVNASEDLLTSLEKAWRRIGATSPPNS